MAWNDYQIPSGLVAVEPPDHGHGRAVFVLNKDPSHLLLTLFEKNLIICIDNSGRIRLGS